METMELNISLSGNNAISLVSGAWNKINTFDDAVEYLPEIQKKALDTAAYILKESVKDTFVEKMPAAGRPFKVPATTKGGYKITRPDPLEEAVLQKSAENGHAKVFMGGREPNSPLFIARMYNVDSKDRYVKSYRGVRLKNKKFTGHLTGKDFWDPGIQSGEQEAIRVVNKIYYNYTKRVLEGNDN